MANKPFTGLGAGTDVIAVPGRRVEDIEVAVHDGGISCGEGYFPWGWGKRKGSNNVASFVENTRLRLGSGGQAGVEPVTFPHACGTL